MKQLIIKFSLVILMSLAFHIAALALLPQSKTTARAAGDRYVATAGTDSGNDCSNSAAPCATVQQAVDVAAPGDVIKIAAGAYTGVNNYGGLSQVVYISKTVTLRGGYTAAFLDPPDSAANPTTLDAQSQGRVIYVTGDISPTIEGLRITGGNAINTQSGGGIYVISSTVTIINNTVFSNTASGDGGGIFIELAKPIVYGNHISFNVANEAKGGGLALMGSGEVISNVIADNRAEDNGGGGVLLLGGGGLVESLGSAIFSQNVVADNEAHYGGGIDLVASTAILSGNVICGNSAKLCDGCDNQSFGGGVLIDQESDATLVNNIIADNHADTAGSGIFVSGSSPLLIHNTIANNSGGDGTGIAVIDRFGVFDTVSFTNTILVNHTIGISVTTGNTATLESTLWNGNTLNWAGTGVIATGSNNYVGNPAFVDSANGDYHLGLTSAALNKGISTGITTDIDGESRDSSPDLGADENPSAVPSSENSYLPIILK